MTKQQAPRLPPYSYSCTSYTLWDCCRSSKHVDQTTVPGTVTRVYENATCSPQNCNLIHVLAPNTVPGTAAALRTIFDQTVPGTVKTVPGDTAVVFWFKVNKQQVTRLPPYSYNWTTYSLCEGCCSSKHVDQTKVPGTVTRVYENATYSPQDCKFIYTVVHNTVPGTAALLRTMLTKQSRGPLKQSLVVLLSSFESKWPNNRSPDCHHIHKVEQHTVPGKAAVLRSMLTKQKSQGPLLFITVFIIVRVWSVMCYHETATLFTLWCTTQSQGLMPFLKNVDRTVPGTITKVYENATHSPEDCNLIHMVVHNTFPGTAALLETILTKQSRGPLPRFARIPHTVPKTVTLFIWWQHTVSEMVVVV